MPDLTILLPLLQHLLDVCNCCYPEEQLHGEVIYFTFGIACALVPSVNGFTHLCFCETCTVSISLMPVTAYA